MPSAPARSSGGDSVRRAEAPRVSTASASSWKRSGSMRASCAAIIGFAAIIATSFTGEMQRQFRAVPRRHARAGDVMVMRAGEAQQHLGIRTVNGFVHAHAGIGRVVETPGEPQWPVLRVYRKRTRMRRR